MEALVTDNPRQMTLTDVPPPGEPGEGQLLLDVDAAGICGSDYGLYLGKHPLSNYPMIQGHEFCGTVRKLGPGCSGRVPVGHRVAVEPLIGCGECYPCSVGRYNCCTNLKLLGVHKPGGFQETLVVDEKLVHDVGDLPADIAAFAEPMTIALQAVKRAGVSNREQVYVIGAGPIGQAIILASLWHGARVAVSDLVEHRLERARSIGAELALNAKDTVAEKIAQWTDGRGPVVVIDATGVPAVIRSAIDIVAAAGRIVTVGISTSDVPLPIATMIRKELTIFASRNSMQMFPEAIRAVQHYRNEVAKLVTQRIGLSEVRDTIELALERPDIVEKAVVVFERAGD
ncbi:zinc-binding dehydrogenase [Phyllobacterium endophyticum]|uniref:Alcohol dehydrogenase n=1 Tax=Phyllobacterium endophyticum TaxID=1149773 RepID=A0A2P7AK72_9HYPH|nr:alcohol dehydrogenase catalytic domain-containing protein [Phyllobacterium endophyticum]MBB3237183.1 threonine dehydrogenase-like Zn-dependent dehydrogenase [Phyllobacterium endophyticum]PSH54600.1 alcohol dehydrogenase [Phyllobacterium endophyticum]TYR40632.1 alcohol dehydrogenase catalytic domain-containing protein [Phyllobacterium endophyticum]